MPLAEDFYSSQTSTSVTVDGRENTDTHLNGPQRKKLRHSVVQNFNRQQHPTHRRFSKRAGIQRAAVENSFTMQGYRTQQSFVVDFEQTPAPAQTQTYAPYALPVCYAPVCCAPHMSVNRWGTFPNTSPAPCNCAPGLQVLTSCDSVACTAASHGGTVPLPFIHYHGIPVPYHCPHFHPHRLPPPSQTPSVIPVSFASSVYQAPTLQPSAVSAVYHQQQQQQQHRGYHGNHQQQQPPVSFHGHTMPVAAASQSQMSAYHNHQVAATQQSTAYHGNQLAPQQPSNYHSNPVTAQQQSAGYHGHQMTSQPPVYLHQSSGHIIPASVQHAHQVNDDIAGAAAAAADATLQTSLVHPSHQSVTAAAAAITGQPLQHAAPTTVPPPSWLLPLSHNDLLAAQVPQYRSMSSARQRWRTYPPVATPYSGYLLHFLAMLGRPTVVSATLPHHRVSLQNEDFTDLDSYEALLSLAERLGEVKSRGLTKPDIDKLPCYRFEATANNNGDRTSVGDESLSMTTAMSAARLDQTSCVVCLCDFELRQMVRILPCRHEFHARCVDRWLKTNRTCPLCRADVTETTKMDVE